MKEPTMNDRMWFAFGIFLFGLGLSAVARGWYEVAAADFAVAGLLLSWHR